MMTKSKKNETIEEYIARGGKIEKAPPQEYNEPQHVVRPTQTSSNIMPLTEGENYFAEKQTRKKASAEEINKKGKDALSSTALKYLNQKD